MSLSGDKTCSMKELVEEEKPKRIVGLLFVVVDGMLGLVGIGVTIATRFTNKDIVRHEAVFPLHSAAMVLEP